MSEVSERYGRIAEGFTSRIGALSAEGWVTPTPCTEWTVSDLVVHVITVHRRLLARLHDADPDEVGVPEGDLAGWWAEVSTEVSAALATPELAAKETQSIGGAQPFEAVAGGLLCADTLVHTWDISRATGLDERLDPDAVRATTDLLARAGDALRVPGGFGPAIEPAPGADEQTVMLNFCGRAV